MRAIWASGLLLTLCLCCQSVHSQTSYSTSYYSHSGSAFRIQELPRSVQPLARPIMENPSFQAKGPVEMLDCDPKIYHWLLDHPEKTTKMWQKLGAPVMEITSRGPGRYGWTDGQGSDVSWVCVVRNAHRRVWYVEGVVKVARLLPKVSIKALMIIHIQELQNKAGESKIRQHSELKLYCGSRAMRLVARVAGASAPKMAETYMEQIQIFFGGMAEYLTADPKKIQKLLK